MSSEFETLVVDNNWSKIEIYAIIISLYEEYCKIENDSIYRLVDVYIRFKNEYPKYEQMTRTFDDFTNNFEHLMRYMSEQKQEKQHNQKKELNLDEINEETFDDIFGKLFDIWMDEQKKMTEKDTDISIYERYNKENPNQIFATNFEKFKKMRHIIITKGLSKSQNILKESINQTFNNSKTIS